MLFWEIQLIGQITMKWEDFSRIWTGKAMIFEPTENFLENKKYQRNYKMLWSLIYKNKKYLIGLSLISAVISAISILTSRFYSYLVDNVIPDNNLKLLWQLLLLTIGIYLFTIVMNWIKLKINIKFNRGLDKELIINIYNRITNLPMSFFASRTSGDLSTRFSDGDSLRSIITNFSLDFIIDFVYAIVALITIIVNHSWQLAVLALLMEELVIIFQQFFKTKMIEQSKASMKASSDVYSFANATFTASETIKNYNSEKLIEESMSKRYKNYQDISYKNQMFGQAQGNVISTITQVSNLFMLSVLGLLVMQGTISVGKLMYLYTLVSYLYGPIDYLTTIQDEIYETNAVLERLDDVFRTSTEEEKNVDKQNLTGKIEKIELKNVTFQYGLREPTLRDISFCVNKGESIGVIGESGCGKTTLIKLIMDFFEVNDGQILVNDRDITELTTSSIRQKIAYVSQNDFWFQDTIFNNLTIGNRNATAEDVERVLETVKMTNYIEKRQYGLNTMLEEGATNLSSGEKQRFSIAKALITNPDVLVLDESTSNLDASTEEFIVNSLAHEKDKIKIVIAHRLNTLAKCDKVIAIKDGYIVESGTPKELLDKKGMFYELWNIQNQALKMV